MGINKEKVQKLAKLARLMFTEQETKQMYKNCPQWKKIEDEIYDDE